MPIPRSLYQSVSLPPDPNAAISEARICMQATDNWSINQQMGRRWPIGCVALEITQRCNLDCRLCYLSAHSEAVHDVPLEEVFRRIDLIWQHYGSGTDVQITGGDPTLRKRQELVAIVQRLRAAGMRATLMTNGIKASRNLLQELGRAGLVDVAFHVDTTQMRKGYHSELALNALREQYLRRAYGLGISIMFNTTVHQGNFSEIPDLVKFFADHADELRLVSFQLQADTGRGVAGKRAVEITPESVWRQIEAGAGTGLNHQAIRAGHRDCNRYAIGIRIGREMYDLLADTERIGQLLNHFHSIQVHRRHQLKSLIRCLLHALSQPAAIWLFLCWLAKQLWLRRKPLVRCRGKITTLSFFVHNFMDANRLDSDRITACAFKVMTSRGTISMCRYNAERDTDVLRPIKLETAKGFWQPLTGKLSKRQDTTVNKRLAEYPLKKLKGKSRQKYLKQRMQAK